MSVWLTIPSARPPEEAEKCLKLWRERGYKIALFIDGPDKRCDVLPQHVQRCECDAVMLGPYPGYAVAVNRLIKMIIERDPTAEWFICAGDDTEPDLNHTAEEIAAQCTEWCISLHGARTLRQSVDVPDSEAFLSVNRSHLQTFGVMQPTGDRFAHGSIDRIAGSPWIGREFARRMYGGNGPYWPEYRHMFVDQELQEIAIKMGVFWQRQDLIHLHNHFLRESRDLNARAVPKPTPEHLIEANSREHWDKYKGIFLTRKAAGFPGHEPIP